MRALAVDPAEEHYTSFTYTKMPQWQNRPESGAAWKRGRYEMYLWGASCGKSQGLLLAHWVLWAFRSTLLSWKLIYGHFTEDWAQLGKTGEFYSYSTLYSQMFLNLCFTWGLSRCLQNTVETFSATTSFLSASLHIYRISDLYFRQVYRSAWKMYRPQLCSCVILCWIRSKLHSYQPQRASHWSATDSFQLTSPFILLKVFQRRPRCRDQGETNRTFSFVFNRACSCTRFGAQTEPKQTVERLPLVSWDFRPKLDVSFQSPPERGAEFNQCIWSFLPFLRLNIVFHSTGVSPPDLIIASKSDQPNQHNP